MNLTRLILERNSGNTESICLTQGDDSYSYGQLFAMVGKVKGFLSGKTGKGDRVGLLCENGIGFVSAYLACLDSGVVVVPTNTSSSREELEYMAGNCAIKLFICSAKMRKKLELGIPDHDISGILEGDGPEARIGKENLTDKGDLAALMHTSGSTGKPNAVMVTHGNLLANTSSILGYLDMKPSDRTMVVLPFYYCYGASLLHMTLCAGGRVVINNKFMFPQRVANEIVEKRCTIFAGVPSTYQIMLKYTRMAEMDMSCLRYALQAGGKLPADHLKQLMKALPGTGIVVMYGQTEATARLSYLPPDLLESKLGSVGRGIPGVELKVIDGSGRDAKPGERGEIIARGNNISPGYLNNDEETRMTFRDGWLHTGDIATVDDEGFIYVVDREKDFVKVGGNRVSLAEIENTALPLKGVSEAIAVGFPDEILGEAVALFVVPANNGLKPQDVMRICSKELPAYKVPKTVRIIDRIPRNAYGKVQRFKLLEQVSVNPGGPKNTAEKVASDG
ncbi:MAG: acyl--CoA ligase [Candidatus Aenigmarchaeota archaeon]|nr:acyl--CoA ligase [Candidatus Aenigmarchaeota archaeon]